ncbi:MAG: dTDP-4-dehydrorhamnose 3,5-epimerase family protein [Pirellulales bacterium]
MKNQQIEGVLETPLKTYKDERGSVTVLYNQQWNLPFEPAQFNFVNSFPNSLRGVHVHSKHSDYLCVLSGKMLLGIKDLRRKSKTFGQVALHTLQFSNPRVFTIPPGVAHGFYFPEETLYCYALSHPWDANEHQGCRWNSPDLGIPWDANEPFLSKRDENAGTVAELLKQIEAIDFYNV